MKLFHKLLIGFVLFLLLSMAAGYFAISESKKILKTTLTDSTESLAFQILGSVEREILNKVNEFRLITSNIILKQEVIMANERYETLPDINSFINEKDREWTSVSKDRITPFMQTIMDTELSRQLKEKVAFYQRLHNFDVIGEIFVTNKYGANIAQTRKTSDYKQDDEGWWNITKRDRVHIGDVEYDESAGMYAIDIGLAIEDENKGFLGVIKIVLNIEYLIDFIKNIKPHGIHETHRNMQIKIITHEGMLIYSSDKNDTILKSASHILPEDHLTSEPSHAVITSNVIQDTHTGSDMLVSHTHSRWSHGLKGFNWILVVQHNAQELFSPVKRLKKKLLLSLSGLLVLVFIIGISIISSISSNSRKLRRAASKIGQGDLDTRIDIKNRDEFGELASVFNKMAEDLKKTTVNRDELLDEIRRRHVAEETFAKSEDRFRSVAENASDAIVYTDSRGEIIFWNNASEKIFGYSANEVVGHSIRCIIPDQFHDEHARAMGWASDNSALMNKGKTRELTAVTKKGDLLPVELSLSTWDITNEKYFTAIIRDISERKKSEKIIEQQIGRLSALRSIDRAIIASLDISVTLDVFLTNVLTQLNVDAASVLLLNHHTQTLEHVLSKGFRSAALKYTRLQMGESNAGRAALERRIVTIPNLREHLDGFVSSESFTSEDFVTYFAVPLIARRQVKGVLELFSRRYLSAGKEWLEFLESIADQGAIALDNATMFDDLQRSNMELSLSYEATIEGWSRALDMRDKETEGHSRRVTEMSVRIAREFKLKDEEIVHIRRGALLHDIGKMGIPDNILLKPGKLTDEEWEVMKLHPQYARDLLNPIEYLRPSIEIPYHHHEKWDGTGYPNGLSKENIPLSARIFAVVDVWDALRSDRPYRPAWPKNKVIDYVRSQVGKHFDAGVIEVFMTMDLY